MEPAASIIQKLGGPQAVASRLGVAYTAPYRWRSPASKGGTDGAIPRKYIPALLVMASEIGVPLSASDFVAVFGGPLADPVMSAAPHSVVGTGGTTDGCQGVENFFQGGQDVRPS